MADGRTGREIILQGLRRALIGLLAMAAIAYVLDFAVLHIRIATNRNPYGTITVRQVYTVPQKNRSTEFLVGDPQDQTCVNSLFPHSGDPPCWYLARHKEQQIDM